MYISKNTKQKAHGKIDGKGGRFGKTKEMNGSQIIYEYEKGLTCRQIAKKHNLCNETIHKNLLKRGIKLRPRGRIVNATFGKKVQSEYDSGEPAKELSKKYNLCVSTIYKHIKLSLMEQNLHHKVAISLHAKNVGKFFSKQTLTDGFKYAIKNKIYVKNCSSCSVYQKKRNKYMQENHPREGQEYRKNLNQKQKKINKKWRNAHKRTNQQNIHI